MSLQQQIQCAELNDRLIDQKYPTSWIDDTVQPHGGYGTSTAWLEKLYTVLREQPSSTDLNDACVELARFKDLDQIRWELSRIPVWSRYQSIAHFPDTNGKIPIHISVNGRTFEVGTSECPDNPSNPDYVFLQTPTYQSVTHNQPVLCFYPPDLAKEIKLPTTISWAENDSIVDWICKFAKIVTHPSVSQTEYNRNAAEEVSSSADELNTENSIPAISMTRKEIDSDNLPSIERIYLYIQDNAPVNAAQIAAQGIVGRRQVFIHLDKLKSAKRIENIGYGLYIPL